MRVWRYVLTVSTTSFCSSLTTLENSRGFLQISNRSELADNCISLPDPLRTVLMVIYIALLTNNKHTTRPVSSYLYLLESSPSDYWAIEVKPNMLALIYTWSSLDCYVGDKKLHIYSPSLHDQCHDVVAIYHTCNFASLSLDGSHTSAH